MRISTVSGKAAMLAALSTAMLAGAAATASPSKKLLAMTPEKFAAAVQLTDDPLETEIVLSTERGFVPRSASMNGVDDNHIRATIDRSSGAVRYEVHQSMRYWGDRRDYKTVNYVAGDGLREAPLKLARHGGDICPNEEIMTPCALTKRVVFEIDETVLRSIAARYTPGNADRWAFKVKDRTGEDWEDAIVPAEAAGLLTAIDRYRTGRS